LSDHANLMQHKNQEPYYIPDVDNGWDLICLHCIFKINLMNKTIL
jgi:hypothetical protein